jgi:hypothetical protein
VHIEITPQSHRGVCNMAYKKAGCKSLNGTHSSRREGCKLADMLDVPDAQMRRLGRWDHSRMTRHYSSGLAKQGARILAGHGSDPGMCLIFLSRKYKLIIYRQLFSKSRISSTSSGITTNDFSTHRGV